MQPALHTLPAALPPAVLLPPSTQTDLSATACWASRPPSSPLQLRKPHPRPLLRLPPLPLRRLASGIPWLSGRQLHLKPRQSAAAPAAARQSERAACHRRCPAGEAHAPPEEWQPAGRPPPCAATARRSLRWHCRERSGGHTMLVSLSCQQLSAEGAFIVRCMCQCTMTRYPRLPQRAPSIGMCCRLGFSGWWLLLLLQRLHLRRLLLPCLPRLLLHRARLCRRRRLLRRCGGGGG